MTSTNTTKQRFSLLLRFGLSGVLLLYIAYTIDTKALFDILKATNILFVAIAFCILAAADFLAYLRWLVYIHALNLLISTWHVTRYFFISLFGNAFLPSSTGGDLIKIAGLCRNSDQKAKVVLSIVFDRISGMAGIILVSWIGYFLGMNYFEDNAIVTPILSLTSILLVTTFIIFNSRTYTFCRNILSPFPKIKDKITHIHDDIISLKNQPRELTKAIVLSCLNQMIYCVVWYVAAKALHQDIDLIYFFMFIPLICIIGTAPSIGGLCVR